MKDRLVCDKDLIDGLRCVLLNVLEPILDVAVEPRDRKQQDIAC
jgi:hypothetical protein